MDAETEKLTQKLLEWGESPIQFIFDMWGLTPQPLKSDYEGVAVENLTDIKAEWFLPFVRGKYITWQQWVILLAVERGLRGEAPRRVSVRSGHGVGKDACLSWLILWYLICFEDSQIPCTAPTADQLYDILWKEIAVWLRRMPPAYQNLFDWTTTHLRMKLKPETWFARARTGRKENPEALAGVHGQFVFLAVDEASGVDEVVFTTMEGALTGQDILVVMVSNPTRLVGYFYDSHHRDKSNWQCLNFNSNESPIVESGYVKRMLEEHGESSDEYAIRVAGEFPRADAVDDQGFVSLFAEQDLRWTTDDKFTGEKRMGVDPSGEGDEDTIWALRDKFKAKVVAKEKISNEKSIAGKTLTLIDYFVLNAKDVTIDNFGQGANVGKEIVIAQPDAKEVYCINVGDHAANQLLFENKRAEGYFRFRNWCRMGGELVNERGLKEEILSIKYRRTLKGRLEIMSKVKMKKEGYHSPNMADAIMLTFIRAEDTIFSPLTRGPIRSKMAGRRYIANR